MKEKSMLTRDQSVFTNPVGIASWIHTLDATGSKIPDWLRTQEVPLGFPPIDLLSALFHFLKDRAPDLWASCRWLLLGPQLSEILLPEGSRKPTAKDLRHLKALLRTHAAELVPLGEWLSARVSPIDPQRARRAAEQIDELLVTTREWSHPASIVHPFAGTAALAQECKLRLLCGPGQRAEERLLEICDKLKRIQMLEEKAARRLRSHPRFGLPR